MPATCEIRADYNKETIVVYQAFSKEIAQGALKYQRFVPPFSLTRMTWIKPSFLWLMERSNWGLKPGQEYILAVRITRKGWEEALANAVLTSYSYEGGIYSNYKEWSSQLESALVQVQWDPERSIRGKALEYKSIQVGLSRNIINRYVNEWTVEINDITPLVRKIYKLVNSGQVEKGKEFLPKERVYPVSPEIARRLGMYHN